MPLVTHRHGPIRGKVGEMTRSPCVLFAGSRRPGRKAAVLTVVLTSRGTQPGVAGSPAVSGLLLSVVLIVGPRSSPQPQRVTRLPSG